MKTKNLLFILTAAFFILIGHQAFAGNRPGVITVTAGAGEYFFSTKRHLQNMAIPNLQVAYNFTDHWAVEGFAGIINTQQRRTAQSVHGALYMFDGLYRFTPMGLFEPYVAAGIGMIGLKPNGTSSKHQGVVNAGLGTQFFMDQNIALRAELRDVYTMQGGKNDAMINFGASVLFGC